MTEPTPRDESRRPIDRPYPREARADRPKEARADRSAPADLDETALGGADAIPDTPDVPDHGADVGEERRRSPRSEPGAYAQASAGKGRSMWLSIAGVVVVLVLLAIMFF